jgi:peptidoglycan hydrolase CwlO-like protein
MEHKYVALGPSQKIYGKKNLLYCQMNLLTATQKYKKYRKLRKEELALKRLLRKTLTDLQTELINLDKSIPHIKEKVMRPENIETKPKKRDTLQDEIDDIKRRIAELG